MSNYPDDADGEVLADLAAHGLDMSQPLPIEFAVYAPSEAAAEKTLNAMTKAGYEAEIEYDEGEPDENGVIDPNDEEFGPSWTVITIIEMVPDYAELMRIQADLDRISGPFGGKSDGWGVMLEDDEDDEEA
jgi:hypothetical protein